MHYLIIMTMGGFVTIILFEIRRIQKVLFLATKVWNFKALYDGACVAGEVGWGPTNKRSMLNIEKSY
uniref:Uncharacterized protein n=1 Tax=Nelumbo nucifera TaxID=4432 RepID=A0A822Y531_NELNU|nr:TPA_asm: hypothetical protein HUJ06_029118 [Nelumbo nucifera]